MRTRIGNFTFISSEALNDLLKIGLVQKYDFAPETREKHDLEAELNKEGKRIKATRKEIADYWEEVLTKPNLGLLDFCITKIANPWKSL